MRPKKTPKAARYGNKRPLAHYEKKRAELRSSGVEFVFDAIDQALRGGAAIEFGLEEFPEGFFPLQLSKTLRRMLDLGEKIARFFSRERSVQVEHKSSAKIFAVTTSCFHNEMVSFFGKRNRTDGFVFAAAVYFLPRLSL